MTQTSVASVWEPRLAATSLPGGLPWPEDETTISRESCVILLAPEAIQTRDVWIAQPQPAITARLPALGSEVFSTTVVRYQRVPNGVVFDRLLPNSEPGPAETHRLIEELKVGLRLSWNRIGPLLGVPKRTLLTYHRAKAVPEERLPALRPRVRVLWTALTDDPDAARVAVEERGRDLERLFADARFSDAQTLFHRTSEQAHGQETRDPTTTIVTHLDVLRRLSAEPAFREIVETVATYGQRTATYAAQRFEAELELLSSLDDARRGDVESPRWDFLPVLSFVAMDALRARAQSYIESEDFSPEGWDRFIESETARAWEHYSPIRGAPERDDPAEPERPAEPGHRRLYRGTYSHRLES